MTNYHQQQGSEQIAGSRQRTTKAFYYAPYSPLPWGGVANKLIYQPNFKILISIATINEPDAESTEKNFVFKCPVEVQLGDSPKLNITIGRAYLFPVQSFQQRVCVKLFAANLRQITNKKLCPSRTFFMQWQIICLLYIYFQLIFNKLQLIVRWHCMKTNFLAARTEADFLVTPESQPCLEHFVANNW